MNIFLELFLALLLLFALAVLWQFLQAIFPAARKKVVIPNSRKGVDNIGVAVVFFCHDGKGEFLVSKRSQKARDEQGRWDPGGGSIEFGETIEEAMKREIKEEYLCDVVRHQFMGYRDVHRTLRDGTPTHWVSLDYKVEVRRDQVGIGEPHVTEELRWVTRDTIPEPMHSQLPFFLEKYKGTLFS